MLRALAILFAALSILGFLNAFVLRLHGPGGDLGIVAGVLALAAFRVDRRRER